MMGYFLSRHDNQSLLTHALASTASSSMAPVNKAFTCHSADVTVSNRLESISSEVYSGRVKSMYCIATLGYGDLIYSCWSPRVVICEHGNARIRRYEYDTEVQVRRLGGGLRKSTPHCTKLMHLHSRASNARCVLMGE